MSQNEEVDIYIERIDASRIRVYPGDAGIREDLYTFFTYEEPGFVKNKWTKWDGVNRMYDKNTMTLPYGLLSMLLSLCVDRQWKYGIDDSFRDDIRAVDDAEIEKFIKGLKLTNDDGKRIEPYDYQQDGLKLAAKFSRLVLLAATSAGKSLIAYMIIRWYQDYIKAKGLKILLIVPSINLVSQMIQNFEEFSQDNKWDVRRHCHGICEGAPIHSRAGIYIATWQSIQDLDAEYFESFGLVICDEVHLASGKKIGEIMKACRHADIRIGMTGTLRPDHVHPVLVQSHFGPIKRIVTTKELQDAGRASKTQIYMLKLNYPASTRKLLTGNYQDEIELLISHEWRNHFLMSLVMTLKGNTLMLFDRVEKHLEVVAEELNRRIEGTNQRCFVITGDVKNQERDEIKRAIENGNEIILLASYGTLSTGVSVRKLHNLVLAHSSKSAIRIIQSLGRLLRLHETKDVANIYDVSDDLTFAGRTNHTMKHAAERYGIYRSEGHPITMKEYQVPE